MSAKRGKVPRRPAPKPPVRRWPALDPLDVVAVSAGFIWLLAALFTRPIGDYGVETDFYGDLVKYSREWMRGAPSVMNGFRGPLYYLLIGVLDLLGDAFLMGKILSVVTAAVAVRLTGGILRRLWNPGVALFGSLFLVANPHWVEYGIRACTDPFYVLLATGCLYLLLVPEPRARLWGTAGALAAGAWLTRYNGVVLLPVAFVAAALVVRPLPRAGRLVALFAAVWLVAVGPWMLYLRAQTGDFLWSNAYQNIAIEAYAPDAATAQNSQFMQSVGFASLGEVWRTYPERFVANLARNAYGHLGDDLHILLGWPWAAAAVLGLALGGRGWLERRRLAFAAAALLTYSSSLTVFYNPRFMLPLLVFWSAGVGLLGAWVAARVPRWFPGLTRRGARPAMAGTWMVALLLVGVAVVANTLVIRASGVADDQRASPTELLQLARAVKTSSFRIDRTTPIAARKPHFGYYVDAPILPVATGTLEDMRKSGAHYLLVSGKEALQYPALMPLMYPESPAKVPAGLTLVAKTIQRYPDGVARGGSLYAIDNPKPWAEPAPRRKPSPERPSLPGLSRIDTLRLRLGLWTLDWGAPETVQSLLDLMSPSTRANPRILQMEGDLRIVQEKHQEAEGLYRKALEAGGEGAPLWGRIAAVQYLSNDVGACLQTLTTRLGAADTLLIPVWQQRGLDAFAAQDYVGAIGPLAGYVAVLPTDLVCTKALAMSLASAKQIEAGKTVCRHYLELQPDDQEIMDRLKELESAGGKPSS